MIAGTWLWQAIPLALAASSESADAGLNSTKIAAMIAGKQYDELWKLARQSSASNAKAALAALSKAHWAPAAEADKRMFVYLNALADRCDAGAFDPKKAKTDTYALRKTPQAYCLVTAQGGDYYCAFSAEHKSDVTIWALSSGSETTFGVEDIDGKSPEIKQMLASPDGKLFAVLSGVGPAQKPAVVEMHEFPSGKLLWKTEPSNKNVNKMSFAADGKSFYFMPEFFKWVKYDLPQKGPIAKGVPFDTAKISTLPGGPHAVPDFPCYGYFDGQFCNFDFDFARKIPGQDNLWVKGAWAGAITTLPEGQTQVPLDGSYPPKGPNKIKPTCSNFALSPDGSYCAGTCNSENSLEVWRIPDGKLILELSDMDTGSFMPLAFSPDSRMLFAGTKSGIEVIPTGYRKGGWSAQPEFARLMKTPGSSMNAKDQSALSAMQNDWISADARNWITFENALVKQSGSSGQTAASSRPAGSSLSTGVAPANPAEPKKESSGFSIDGDEVRAK
jgi:hypothetical protein